MVSNDDSEPLKVLQATQVPKEAPSQIYKVNNTDISLPQPSNPSETPVPSPIAVANNGTHAPVPVPLQDAYQDALRHIRKIETHNAKLYADNCKLINAVGTLDERLTFLGAPQNIQVLRFSDVQERLRMSEANRISINRKYQELLQSVSDGSAQHRVGLELRDTREAFASLDREFRLLRDKYQRLKAVADTGRVVQQQPHSIARGHIPVGRPEFPNGMPPRGYARDQSRGNSSFQSFLDQRRDDRRRSSDGVVAQTSSLRTCSAPEPIATTWLAPLPTPPPTASMHGGQNLLQGFPVHAPAPAGSLPLQYDTQIIHHPRNMTEMSAVTLTRNLGVQGAIKQPQKIDQLHQNSTEDIKDELVLRGNPVPMSPESNQRPQKRPSSELLISTSPEGENKKPRIKGSEADCPTTMISDAYQLVTEPSPIACTSPRDDCKSSTPGSGLRSYQDCVDLIFEKDANVKDGVFCGLCLDRYEAKMIQEPPDVLTQPDFDSLVMHCMTMHPTVWDDLRHKD